ncbi:MAG: LapA family protein [Calditrichaeota bacterium]|nr:MAG: LapA family protein [Calditrichota bacterium]
MKTKYVILIVLLIIFGIFIIQNTASVTVSFLVFDATMPRSLLLILTFALGVFIGVLLPYNFKKHK